MAATIMEISAGLHWLATHPASSHYAPSWILNWSILKYDLNINSKCQGLSSLKKCLLKRLNLYTSIFYMQQCFSQTQCSIL